MWVECHYIDFESIHPHVQNIKHVFILFFHNIFNSFKSGELCIFFSPAIVCSLSVSGEITWSGLYNLYVRACEIGMKSWANNTENEKIEGKRMENEKLEK